MKFCVSHSVDSDLQFEIIERPASVPCASSRTTPAPPNCFILPRTVMPPNAGWRQHHYSIVRLEEVTEDEIGAVSSRDGPPDAFGHLADGNP